MSQSKTEWRRVLLGARRALPPELRRSHSLALAARLRAEAILEIAAVVLAYEPIGAEVDPGSLVAAAHSAGRPVYLPDGDGAPRWIRCAGGPDESPAILTADTLRGSPTVVLVPGVGFDPAGTRLGRGAGYYDRALAHLRGERPVVAIGLAYEVQIVPLLPSEPWDQRVDLIATEARVIRPTDDARASAARDVEEVPRS
jgi:5-formyltetrahydrofolate cyclo-ligase